MAIQELLSRPAESLDWQTLVVGLDELNDRLARAWGPVGHLNSVCNSPELRTAYEACPPKLSAYYTELGQNRALFEAYQGASGPAAAGFEVAQKTILEHSLRDFRLSGIDLPPVEQQRFGAIQMKRRAGQQVLQPAAGRHAGPGPGTSPTRACWPASPNRPGADGRGGQGQGPRRLADHPGIPQLLRGDDLRRQPQPAREVYTAYCTRASDQGPNAGQFDNGPVMAEILELRHELAGLLGYRNFAELSLATKMAESTEQVLSFLRDLAVRSKPFAERDLAELRAFAAEQGLDDLQSWDLGYYAEKLRQQRYSLNQEELRAYFPIDKVLSGLFGIVQRLYGIQIHELEQFDGWHPDVRLFEITENSEHVGRSSSTSTRGRTSAAAPGWTAPATSAAPQTARCRRRWPTWSATSPRRWASARRS